jgi:hypothetical protein
VIALARSAERRKRRRLVVGAAGLLAVVLILVTVASLLAADYFNRLRLSEAQAAQNERDAQHDEANARRWPGQMRASYHPTAGCAITVNTGNTKGWRTERSHKRLACELTAYKRAACGYEQQARPAFCPPALSAPERKSGGRYHR